MTLDELDALKALTQFTNTQRRIPKFLRGGAILLQLLTKPGDDLFLYLSPHFGDCYNFWTTVECERRGEGRGGPSRTLTKYVKTFDFCSKGASGAPEFANAARL